MEQETTLLFSAPTLPNPDIFLVLATYVTPKPGQNLTARKESGQKQNNRAKT